MVCKRVEFRTRGGKRVVFEVRVKKRFLRGKSHAKPQSRKRKGTQVSFLTTRR